MFTKRKALFIFGTVGSFVLFLILVQILIYRNPSNFTGYPLTTGTVTQLKFEDECFDLDTSSIFQSRSFFERCDNPDWDFVFAYDSEQNPHAVLLLNPLSKAQIAYQNDYDPSITLSTMLVANFSSVFQDRSFKYGVIKTSKNAYYKLRILRERSGSVTFEWENLKS